MSDIVINQDDTAVFVMANGDRLTVAFNDQGGVIPDGHFLRLSAARGVISIVPSASNSMAVTTLKLQVEAENAAVAAAANRPKKTRTE